MASAASRAAPKMAAGGPARRARGRSETPGPTLPGRQPRRKAPGRCVKGPPVPARPAGEAPAAARSPGPAGSRSPSPGSSHEAADGRPTKRLKREKESLVKSELKGVKGGSGNLASLGETAKTSDRDGCSEDPGDSDRIPEKKSESIPECNEDKQEEHSAPLEPRALKSRNAPSGMDSKEESSCESLLSAGSSLEDADVPRNRAQLDSSAVWDEDSNQPMPVARFFGDVELLRDLPAVALPSTATSRREFRKLHFIAKEDEEEEEDVA